MAIKTVTITKRLVEAHHSISEFPYPEFDLEVDGEYYGYFHSILATLEYCMELFGEVPLNVHIIPQTSEQDMGCIEQDFG